MNGKPKLKRMSGSMQFTITPPKLKPNGRTNFYLLVLKSLVYALGPLIVPTIVYGVEGCTTLFWWILGIAFITSLLLLTFDTEKIKNLMEYLKLNQKHRIRCVIKGFFLILVCGVGSYAYHIHLHEVFCVCLFMAGAITGTFFSDITTWWISRRKKNLPYMNFTKDSPKPLFLNLREKSRSGSVRASNLLPLNRQLSSPTKKSSNFLKCPTLERVRSANFPMSSGAPTVPKTPVMVEYPSVSSSSGESDVAEVSCERSMILTPTKRRVISAESISLSPLMDTPKTSPMPKRRLEFPGNDQSQNMELTPVETPSFIYTNCNVESLMSQNFSFFHM